MKELSILSEEVGVSERTLRRAINNQTLRASRPSPRKLKISLSEKQFISRNWGLISSLQSALRTEHNVRFALLFGSVARGEATAGSDIDLLVEMRDGTLERQLELEIKLEDRLGKSVEVVLVNDARRNPVLMAQAVADGRLLLDRDGRWAQIQEFTDADAKDAEILRVKRTREALDGIDSLLAARNGGSQKS